MPFPEAIVFDFDGVIVNSEPLHLEAAQDVLNRRGIALEPEEYYERYVGFDDVGMFWALSEDRRLNWCSDDLQEMLAAKALRFEELERECMPVVPGAIACVRRMAGIAPVAVASGARRDEIVRILERLDLAAIFRTIVASGDTPFSKPAPDPYLEAASRLGVRPARTVAVEDTAAGLASARGAGLRCIGITTTFPAARLSLADVIVGSMDEITADLVGALVA